MRTQWTIIAALLFALVTGIFAVINVEPVMVDFLFASTETPLILVILASTLLGGLTVGLFGIVRQYRLQRRIKQLEKQLAALGVDAAAEAAQTAPAPAPEFDAAESETESGEPAASGRQQPAE